MSQEDCESIFKLRCRETKVKANMKGNYENYECDACGEHQEDQEHILKCDQLSQMNKSKNDNETPDYDKIFDGNVMEQVTIAKIFQQKMKLMEQYKTT